MKKYFGFLLSLFVLFQLNVLGQDNSNASVKDDEEDNEPLNITVDNFSIQLNSSILTVEDSLKQVVFSKAFNDPRGYVVDLDGDGTSEFLINDYIEEKGQNYYSLYVFNTVDTFYLADSIYSGLKEPYYTHSNEINNTILITGSPDVDSLSNSQTEQIFSPLVCWAVTDGELTIVNDQIYDLFMEENEKIITFIDSIYKTNGRDCTDTEQVKAAIATLFINYNYADEQASAEGTLKHYYLCGDLEEFRNYLLKLL